ncbi:MAG: glutathione S-transferase family protein [Polyangiales bacterium]
MITVHSIPRGYGLSSLSPFCAKVEVFLTMAGLPFMSVPANYPKAPKGKTPWITDDDGAPIADSSIIVDHLVRKHGVTLDAHLDAESRARGHAIKRLFEESLYFVILWQNWAMDENFAHLRAAFAPTLPAPLRPFLPAIIRRSVMKSLKLQGTGRHAPAEIAAAGIADVDALATLLGDRPFFLGEEPSTVDATAYAFLAWIIKPPMTSKTSEHTRSIPRFRSYIARMEERFRLGEIPGASN